MSKKRYPVRVPRYVAGIRAQETRASGARTWWGRAWTACLERMGLGARLGRGKNYALLGQIATLQIAGPHVEASVVGMRAEPYRVTIDFRTPAGAPRARLVDAIRREPMLG
ncbi:MAG: hypothetical protein IJ829_08320, partial [Kiritimatiellae bacterium]|nr:hypothetical protein [Kiritimatiellia bacterium]